MQAGGRPCAPWLRLSMGLGALYDVILGLAIVLALGYIALILPIPMPAQPFYARTVGVLLICLGCFYGIAWLDLDANLRNVAGAIAARTLGGLFVALYPLLDPSVSWFFIVFGALDLFWAAMHLTLLHREAGGAFWPLLLRGAPRR